MIDLFNQFFFQQGSNRTVKGSGAQSHAALSLFRNTAHDCIAVKVFPDQGEQDLKCGGG